MQQATETQDMTNRDVLDRLGERGLQVLKESASSDEDSKVFILHLDQRYYVDVELFEDGSILAVTSNGSGKPQVWSVPRNPEGIDEAANRILDFIKSHA